MQITTNKKDERKPQTYKNCGDIPTGRFFYRKVHGHEHRKYLKLDVGCISISGRNPLQFYSSHEMNVEFRGFPDFVIDENIKSITIES